MRTTKIPLKIALIVLTVILTLLASSTVKAPANERVTFMPIINVKTIVKETPITVEPIETIETLKTEIYEITQYTSGYESTQKRPGDKGYGITSSGVKATANHTAACAKTIPYGSTVYIPELDAVYVCEDRGNAITDGKIDIYVTSVKAAKRFGRQKMAVIITQK